MNLYCVGGLTVEMTYDQAERWECGELTDLDRETITVNFPDQYEQASHLRDGEIVMHSPQIVKCSYHKPISEITDDDVNAGGDDGETVEKFLDRDPVLLEENIS